MESHGTLLRYVRSLKQSPIVSRQYLSIPALDDALDALSRGLLAFIIRLGPFWISNNIFWCHGRAWPHKGINLLYKIVMNLFPCDLEPS